ncbi:alpha/beta hydrolase [Acinetobacter sp. WZC-1]|uniref:alpha/beta hydrolase n=1 Tax=Acinetobacter sp. WZC-1 TaxID=3459034 RepID=UPI00403DE9E8
MSYIYRYHDQQELDRQYFIRGTVPDIMPIMQQYAERTATVRRQIPCFLDIAYGDTEAERLDIFPATDRQSDAPVFVFIHGGFWKMLNAADSGFMARTFADQGACVVVINYALAPTASIDQIVDQCRKAIAWTYRHITEYGGNPDRIHVGGSSAGGHLAGMILAQNWREHYQVPALKIKGGLMLSGLYDLLPIVPTHINEWAHLDEDKAIRNSPIQFLPEAGVSLIFSYAPNETEQFKMQTERYMTACQVNGCSCQFVAVPDSNHFDIVFEMADPDSEMCRLTFEMMGI